MRRYTIANANIMMDICKGKVRLLLVSGHITALQGKAEPETPAVTRLCLFFQNVILSSAAETVSLHLKQTNKQNNKSIINN